MVVINIFCWVIIQNHILYGYKPYILLPIKIGSNIIFEPSYCKELPLYFHLSKGISYIENIGEVVFRPSFGRWILLRAIALWESWRQHSM
jgi:hypothetical protein